MSTFETYNSQPGITIGKEIIPADFYIPDNVAKDIDKRTRLEGRTPYVDPSGVIVPGRILQRPSEPEHRRLITGVYTLHRNGNIQVNIYIEGQGGQINTSMDKIQGYIDEGRLVPVGIADEVVETEEHVPVLLEYTEEKRRHDKGGQQIAILRDIYRYSDPHMRHKIMGMFDGADELYALALDSRRDVKLDDNERDFVDYMRTQAKNVRISAMLDWDKLEGEEADEIIPNISQIIERVPLAVADAKQAGDTAKAKRLTAQLPYLKVYKHLKSGESDNEVVDITEAGSKNHLGEYTGHEYMSALMEMKLAQRDMMMPTADKLAAAEKFKQAKKLLELRSTLFFMQAVAMEAIYEHGPEFRNDTPELSDDMDPRFVYEDSRGESPKQKPKNAEGMSWVEEPDNPYDFAIEKGRAALKYGKWHSEMTKAEREAKKRK